MNENKKDFAKNIFMLLFIVFTILILLGCKTSGITDRNTDTIFSTAEYTGELRGVIGDLDATTRNVTEELLRIQREFDERSGIIGEQINNGLDTSRTLTERLKLAVDVNQRLITAIGRLIYEVDESQHKIEETAERLDSDFNNFCNRSSNQSSSASN